MRTAAIGAAVFIVGACNVVLADDQLRPFAPRLEIPGWKGRENAQLCQALLADLRKWQNVSEIKPVVTAAHLKSAELRDAFGNCDPERLLTSYKIDPQVWREENLDALSPEERQGYGEVFVMSGELRLYRANIDNDPSGSQELIVHGAVATASGELVKSASEFRVLDIHRCATINTAQVSDSSRNSRFFASLLRHGARTYVFDARVYPNELDSGRTQRIEVRLQQWAYADETKEHFFSNTCSYEAEVQQ